MITYIYNLINRFIFQGTCIRTNNRVCILLCAYFIDELAEVALALLESFRLAFLLDNRKPQTAKNHVANA